MRLLRYGPAGGERPGLLDADGAIRDLTGLIGDITPDVLLPAALDELRSFDPSTLPRVSGAPRLGTPVADIRKVLCIGLNYSDHAAEVGAALPQDAIFFMKPVTAITGPTDPIIQPVDSTKLDWEVELCAVIGRTAQYVSEEAALDHVAGYMVGNDVSERQFQLERSGQWTKGKSHDSFAPLGPWLVTADEVPDPQALGLWLDVNGERMQTGTTGRMIFSVRQVIAYASRFMTLEPGDVIMTGTPPGVGAGKQPPRFLKPGDVVSLGVAGLGEQRSTVVAWSERPR